MRNYYRVMLGKKSVFAQECFDGGFIGVDFLNDIDLSAELPDNWRHFNRKYIPVCISKEPGKQESVPGWHAGFCGRCVRGSTRKTSSYALTAKEPTGLARSMVRIILSLKPAFLIDGRFHG